MDIGAVLRATQRERMADAVAERASHRIEEFDWASATRIADVVQLHSDLGPYARLISQLRDRGFVDDVELLRTCATEVRDDYRRSVEHERRTLEQLRAGEWDYAEPDTPENRSEIERQAQGIIDTDGEVVALAETVLGTIGELAVVT